MLTVAVIDDHPATRLGIIAALKKIPDIDVVGEAGSGPELAALLKEGVPEVVVLAEKSHPPRSPAIRRD